MKEELIRLELLINDLQCQIYALQGSTEEDEDVELNYNAAI